MITILYGVLGGVIGSFLNVVIDRLPRHQSLISPPSHCPECERQLSAWELIPVVSYLVLRGRCRTCGGRIPLRVLMVEAGTGLLFALAAARFGITLFTFIASVFIAFLIVIMVIDWETQRILNRVSYPALGLGLLSVPFSPAAARLAGGLVGLCVLLAIALLSRGGMGMGDVKLAAFIGVIVGLPQILLAMFIAFVAGGVIVGALWTVGKVGRKDPVAFGPYLALGGIVTLLYGEPILNWWMARSWL